MPQHSTLKARKFIISSSVFLFRIIFSISTGISIYLLNYFFPFILIIKWSVKKYKLLQLEFFEESWNDVVEY